MLPLFTLEKTDNSVLYKIPDGKPNPYKNGEGRVFQSAQKGNTCWYYAFNFLRKRIGKNPSQDEEIARYSEKICSQRRKEITQSDASPSSLGSLTAKYGLDTLERIDLRIGKFLIENPNEMQGFLNRESFPQDLMAPIEQFIKDGTCSRLSEFLLNQKLALGNEINKKFLVNFYKNTDTLLEIDKIDNFLAKSCALNILTLLVSAEFYNLKESLWTPLQGINDLVAELANKGPLFVTGRFGITAYIDPPFKMDQKVADRDIYTWHPEAKRKEDSLRTHAILLTGAKKIQDKAYVFFIDPNDSSDPMDSSAQRIYMMSFTNLTSNICDLVGMNADETEGDVGFAFHGDFKILT